MHFLVRLGVLTLLLITLAVPGCKRAESSHVQPHKDTLDLKYCIERAGEGDCEPYKVISYDATWRNDLGNEGEFVIEGRGTRIRAFCSGQPGSCSLFANGVGQIFVLDRSITDLLVHHDSICRGDPDYVKNAIEQRRRMTGKYSTEGDVCDITLVVEKIEAK